MSIPTKGFFDPPTDSVESLRERAEKIRAEAAEQAKAREEAEQRRLEREAKANEQARKEEEAYVQNAAMTVETREHLMARILAMRAQQPEPPKPPPMTERMKKQLEEEQEAGRQAVAKAQAQDEWARQVRLKAQQEDAAKEGSMAPVVHPNPSMDEKFPVNKATIK